MPGRMCCEVVGCFKNVPDQETETLAIVLTVTSCQWRMNVTCNPIIVIILIVIITIEQHHYCRVAHLLVRVMKL